LVNVFFTDWRRYFLISLNFGVSHYFGIKSVKELICMTLDNLWGYAEFKVPFPSLLL